MSKEIVLVGDGTDHDGTVVTGSDTDMIDGKPMARIGDLVDCPKHGLNKIIEGDPAITIDGIPVAVTNCKTECGSRLKGSGDPVGSD
ncbi:PAAR domain-containing protein [Collimonas silvisoli]|uniref:PAAR domain-containing protein n=1 Tax=Collimonas silvisoli TaxID=2825884 RepID=UPI001B8AB2BB|nr:PAAR domain-containing protein [Collimonas silvisoli]